MHGFLCTNNLWRRRLWGLFPSLRRFEPVIGQNNFFLSCCFIDVVTWLYMAKLTLYLPFQSLGSFLVLATFDDPSNSQNEQNDNEDRAGTRQKKTYETSHCVPPSFRALPVSVSGIARFSCGVGTLNLSPPVPPFFRFQTVPAPRIGGRIMRNSLSIERLARPPSMSPWRTTSIGTVAPAGIGLRQSSSLTGCVSLATCTVAARPSNSIGWAVSFSTVPSRTIASSLLNR